MEIIQPQVLSHLERSHGFFEGERAQSTFRFLSSERRKVGLQYCSN